MSIMLITFHSNSFIPLEHASLNSAGRFNKHYFTTIYGCNKISCFALRPIHTQASNHRRSIFIGTLLFDNTYCILTSAKTYSSYCRLQIEYPCKHFSLLIASAVNYPHKNVNETDLVYQIVSCRLLIVFA